MLVDLGRNDLSRVCKPGTVRVGKFLEPERYSHVTHLVSEVAGELLPGTGPFDLLRACFPAGTVSGAPKVRAMQIISELEGYRRGPYAGAVGYALPGGSFDTCIAIRTVVLEGGLARLQAGAGSSPTRIRPPSTRSACASSPRSKRRSRRPRRALILLIDNYDSFTYNLAHLFQELGAEVTVVRNDKIDADEAEKLEPSHLVISPGPGRPADAGASLEIVRRLGERVPTLGVCLGHQAIVEAFGGEVGQAKRLMHGKASPVAHDGAGLFAGLPDPLESGRYHSLAATRVPESLEVCATTEDGEVMAVRHRELPVDGIQFHPESVLTPDGPELARNFLEGGDDDPGRSRAAPRRPRPEPGGGSCGRWARS